MARRNKSIKLLALLACIVLFASIAIGVAACNKNKDKEQHVVEAYYLSSSSNNWATYNSADDIPSAVKFISESENSVYSLTTELAASDEFTINCIGANDVIGYDNLFSSSDKIVEGVNKRFKAAANGIYNIKLHTSDGNSVTYTFVSNEVTVTNVAITHSVASMEIDEEVIFEASVTYSDTSQNADVNWSSDNPQVATIDSTGKVKAISAGTVNITATAVFDDTKSATVQLTVNKKSEIEITSVTVQPTDILLEIGETSTLTATVLPAEASQNGLWSSEDDTVASVDQQGVVTAVAAGQTVIKFTTAKGGYSAECHVTVRRAVRKIKLTEDELTVRVGGKAKEVNVQFVPASATITTYSYEVTDGADKISISQNEKTLSVSGLAQGKATIVVTSLDNTNAKASLVVNVEASGTVIPEVASTLRVGLNEKLPLTASLEGASVKSVSWTIADSSVATLSANSGETVEVTGLVFGSTTITANITGSNGQQYTKRTKVLVADSFFIIYGVGIGEENWKFDTYLTDQDEAYEMQMLLEEERFGVYSLTRHLSPSNGFQIIFPTVANFTDGNGTWNRDIKHPYEYFDEANSDVEYCANIDDQFKVNMDGIYKITLDLTGSSAKVAINIVSVDINNIALSIEQGDGVLRSGDTSILSIKVNPSKATVDKDKMSVELTSDYDDFAKYATATLDADKMQVTVSITGTFDRRFTLTVIVSIGEVQGTLELPVLSANDEEIAVSSITFDEEDGYYINVNNGGKRWETTVSAFVNQEATNKGIIYSTTSDLITVNPTTGLVVASAFGTFEITATAVGNSDITATTTVTVYSDTFYLIGNVNNELQWDNPGALSAIYTSIPDDSPLVKYAFAATDTSNRTFTLTTTLLAEDKFQIVFLGMDDSWTNALTAEVLNLAGSNNTTVFETKNARVTQKGVYTVTIDLSDDTPSFTVIYKEAAIDSVTLKPATGQSASVHLNDKIDISVSLLPANVTYVESDFEWSVQEGYEDYVSIDFDFDALKAQLTVLKAPEQGSVTVAVMCSLKGVTGIIDIVILSAGSEEIKPTSISFEQEAYYVNVNNGGEAWVADVLATVDDAATNKQVKYSDITVYSQFGMTLASQLRPVLDADTGHIIARVLGTMTEKATAVGDESVFATCTVTFYSDELYLIGDYTGGWTALSASVKTAKDTAFGNYVLTQHSPTHYSIEMTFESVLQNDGGFQIAFCGMSSWDAAISAKNNMAQYGTAEKGQYGSDADYRTSDDGRAIFMMKTGTYLIDVDLSKHMATFTINYTNSELTYVVLDYDKSITDLSVGDSIQIRLGYFPQYIKVLENDIRWSITSGANYVEGSFDYNTLTYTLNVNSREQFEDQIVRLRCYVNNKFEQVVEFTLKAAHHLAWDHDNDYHWQYCTDDGCEFKTDKESHNKSEAWEYDATSHYHVCTTCGGGKVDIHPHTGFSVDADGWWDGNGTCNECNFSPWTVSGSTITAYNGTFEKVRIPREINGVQIAALGGSVFANNQYLKQIDIQNNIANIGYNQHRTFENCINLQSVVLPDSVIRLGSALFRGCSNLTSATLGLGIHEITQNLFADCIKLKDLVIKGDITIIQDGAFANCVELETFEVDDSVTEIKFNAFQNTSVQIIWGSNPTIKKISGFRGWKGTEFTVPKSVERLGGFEGSSLTHITIPDNVKFIDSNAFKDCKQLEYVEIGAGVVRTEDNAFSGCSSLKKILIKSLSLNFIGSNVFNGCTSLQVVYFNGTKDYINGIKIEEGNDLLFASSDGTKYCYIFSRNKPSSTMDYGQFAGAWHYDTSGTQDLDHVLLW